MNDSPLRKFYLGPLSFLFFAVVAIATGALCYWWGGMSGASPAAYDQQLQTEQAFIDGYTAYAKTSAAKIESRCRDTGRDMSLFCFEGYFFADLVARPSLDKFTADEISPKRFAEFSPHVPEFLRAIWLTSLGLALAQRDVNPKAVSASLNDPAMFAQVVDGWAFRKYQIAENQPSKDMCAGLKGSFHNACQFGMGRASFFERNRRAPIVNPDPYFVEGFAFASAYTHGGSTEGTTPPLPAQKGGKAAVLVKQIWLNNPAYVPKYEKFYTCTSKDYLADCLDRID